MMNKISLPLTLLLTLGLINNAFAVNPTSNWWDYCLDNTVTYALFAEWLGDVNSPSRMAVRNYLKQQSYKSLLDIPCGLCIDHFGLKKDGLNIVYNGMDFSRKLVDKAQQNGIAAQWGDIENINHDDNCFDVVHCRHILEHLSHYKQAVSEVIRIAKKEVIIVFFIKPTEREDDFIDLGSLDGHAIHHNRYSKDRFVEYVLTHHKVSSITWELIGENESIAHILMKE